MKENEAGSNGLLSEHRIDVAKIILTILFSLFVGVVVAFVTLVITIVFFSLNSWSIPMSGIVGLVAAVIFAVVRFVKIL